MKKDKKYNKIILKLVIVGIIIIGGTIFILNQRTKDKVINEIKSFNGYMPPKGTYLYGLKLNFNNVECNGLFKYNCKIKDFKIIAQNDKLNETFFKAKEVELKDISKDMLSKRNINIKIKDFEPSGRLKDIIYPQTLTYNSSKKLAKEVYQNLFPLDLSLKINMRIFKNKENLKNGEGTIEIGIEDKAFKFKGKTFIVTKETKKPYSIVIDKNGTLIRDKNIQDKKLAEFKMNQRYFTIIKSLSFNFKNNSAFKTFYKMYKLNMEEYKNKRAKINNIIFGMNTDKELSYEEFKKEFIKRMNLYKKDNPNKIGKDSSSFVIDMVKGKKKKMLFSMEMKKYITLEEYLLLTTLIKDKEKIIEDYYKVKTLTK